MKSGFQMTWTLIGYQLPTDTAEAKRGARQFRRVLLSLGAGKGTLQDFRLGRGVGLISCDYNRARKTLSENVPPNGEVRCVPITDKQYEHSYIGWGKLKQTPTGRLNKQASPAHLGRTRERGATKRSV